MTKRTTLAMATLVTGSLALAACGSGSDPDASAPDAPVPFYSDKASWEPQFQRVSEASTAANGFGLNISGYSDANAYSSFVKQAFRTSDKPTLFSWHTGDSLGELVDEGLLVETTDQWRTAIDAGDVPEGLADYYTYDGAQYCVPLNVAYWVMYYNVSVFEENDITPPTTWAELVAASDTLKAAGVTPFYQTNSLFSFAWFQTILAGQDPEAYEGLSDGSVQYTDPAVVHAMETWGEMMRDDYFSDPGVATEPSVMLQNGDVAMLNFGSFMTGQLTQLGMEEGTDYGTFVIPALDPDLDATPLLVETSPICQAKDAPAGDNATTFTRWWFTQPAQEGWASSTQSLSFNPRVPATEEGMRAVQEGVGSGDYRLMQRYFEATPMPVVTAALDGFGQFISSPTDDPVAILETIQAAADAHWADQE